MRPILTSLALISGGVAIAATHAAAASPPRQSPAGGDACGWKVQHAALYQGYPSYLTAVSADAKTDVWAVGFQAPTNGNGPINSLVEHWNGSRWAIGPAVNGPFGQTQLDAVAALSPSDVWAVGWIGNAFSGPIYTLAEHWDGTKWSIIATPKLSGDAILAGIAALSDTDAWAVGYRFVFGQSHSQTLAEHWNGKKWSVVPTVSPSKYRNSLFGVAGSGSNDVWAVGQAEAVGGGALAEHWDGRKWSLAAVPSPNNATLQAVTETAPNDAWAVGSSMSTSPTHIFTLTEHWDGTAWKTVSSPNVPNEYGSLLSGASHTKSSDVWAAGYWQTSSSGLTVGGNFQLA